MIKRLPFKEAETTEKNLVYQMKLFGLIFNLIFLLFVECLTLDNSLMGISRSIMLMECSRAKMKMLIWKTEKHLSIMFCCFISHPKTKTTTCDLILPPHSFSPESTSTKELQLFNENWIVIKSDCVQKHLLFLTITCKSTNIWKIICRLINYEGNL